MSVLFPLHVRAAETRQRGTRLVGPVDLKLDGDGTTVVIGPNGSGKTSLLGLLHGTRRTTRGEITWSVPMDDARTHQAFVFQRPIMLRRSVLHNIAYPLRVRGIAAKDARAKAETWAARVGLETMLDRPARSLSGGEQQKLALARAMIAEPRLLFLDEPTSSLDGRSTREIEAILAQVRESGTALILSTHDLGQARRMADEVIFMLHGKIHEHSPADAFFAAPKTKEAAAFLRGDIVE